MAGVVYFVQDSTFNFTKIGHAKGSIKDVLEKLQFGNPITLTVYKTIKCLPHCPSERIEHHLHNLFAVYHIRNEWFEITKSQIDEACVVIESEIKKTR